MKLQNGTDDTSLTRHIALMAQYDVYVLPDIKVGCHQCAWVKNAIDTFWLL